MYFPGERGRPSLPVRNAGESPIRHRGRSCTNDSSSSNSRSTNSNNSYGDTKQQKYSSPCSSEREKPPARSGHFGEEGSRIFASNGKRKPNSKEIRHQQQRQQQYTDRSRVPPRVSPSRNNADTWQSSSTNSWQEDGSEQEAEELWATTTKQQRRKLRASNASVFSVDQGLARVGESLPSSWSAMSVLPPSPNGEAVPALLSHLAGVYSYD